MTDDFKTEIKPILVPVRDYFYNSYKNLTSSHNLIKNLWGHTWSRVGLSFCGLSAIAIAVANVASICLVTIGIFFVKGFSASKSYEKLDGIRNKQISLFCANIALFGSVTIGSIYPPYAKFKNANLDKGLQQEMF